MPLFFFFDRGEKYAGGPVATFTESNVGYFQRSSKQNFAAFLLSTCHHWAGKQNCQSLPEHVEGQGWKNPDAPIPFINSQLKYFLGFFF